MSDPVAKLPVVKRPSRLRAWARALGIGLLVTLVVWVISWGIRSWVARARLDDALARLDRTDPGWRLMDIEAARAAVPDAENSALTVMDVEKKLPEAPNRWIEPDFDTQLQGSGPSSA